jgi:DNA-binding LacI/PurR family transcriptional regulator
MARVTMRDVAAACGVSRSTVSFVLNDTPNQVIAPQTRERVRRAAQDLGYVPHGLAKALREGASRIVVLNVDTGFEGNYSRGYVRGLDDELRAHDHVLLVRYGHRGADAAQQVLDAITPRAVLEFGVVYRTGRALEDAGGGWADGLAAHAAIQLGYLADRGHRHVALAIPDNDPPLRATRLRFARQTARRLGLAPLTSLVVARPRAAGTRAVEAFLAAHGAVTAIAGYDDEAAIRTLAALHDLGRRVPDDIAVIGFDDTEHGELTTPALTTVRMDAEAHGRIAARTALGLDAGDLVAAPGSVIARGSA